MQTNTHAHTQVHWIIITIIVIKIECRMEMDFNYRVDNIEKTWDINILENLPASFNTDL